MLATVVWCSCFIFDLIQFHSEWKFWLVIYPDVPCVWLEWKSSRFGEIEERWKDFVAQLPKGRYFLCNIPILRWLMHSPSPLVTIYLSFFSDFRRFRIRKNKKLAKNYRKIWSFWPKKWLPSSSYVRSFSAGIDSYVLT
jgi:hypothetical protein